MPTTLPRLLDAFVSVPGRDRLIRQALTQDPTWVPDPGPADVSLWQEIVTSRTAKDRTRAAKSVDSVEGLVALTDAPLDVPAWRGVLSNPRCAEEGAEVIYERALAFGRGRAPKTQERLADAVLTGNPEPSPRVRAILAAAPWFVNTATGTRLFETTSWASLPLEALGALVAGPIATAKLVTSKLRELMGARGDPAGKEIPDDVILALASQTGHGQDYLEDICDEFTAWVLRRRDWDLYRQVLTACDPCPRAVAEIVVAGKRQGEVWAVEAEHLASLAMPRSKATRQLWVEAIARARGTELLFSREFAKSLAGRPDGLNVPYQFVRVAPADAAAIWDHCPPTAQLVLLQDLESRDRKAQELRYLLLRRADVRRIADLHRWLGEQEASFLDEVVSGIPETSASSVAYRLFRALNVNRWAQRRREGTGLEATASRFLSRYLSARYLSELIAALHPDALAELERWVLEDPSRRGDGEGWRALKLALLAERGAVMTGEVVQRLLATLDPADVVEVVLTHPVVPGTLTAAVANVKSTGLRSTLRARLTGPVRGRPVNGQVLEEALALVGGPIVDMGPDAKAAADRLLARSFGDDSVRWEVALGLLGTWEGTIPDLIDSVEGVVAGPPEMRPGHYGAVA